MRIVFFTGRKLVACVGTHWRPKCGHGSTLPPQWHARMQGWHTWKEKCTKHAPRPSIKRFIRESIR